MACKRHASGQSENPDGDAFHEQICENEIQVLTCGPIQSYMINIKSVRVPWTSFRPFSSQFDRSVLTEDESVDPENKLYTDEHLKRHVVMLIATAKRHWTLLNLQKKNVTIVIIVSYNQQTNGEILVQTFINIWTCILNALNRHASHHF